MKAANLKTSHRLQRVMSTLMRGGEWSTLELGATAQVQAVNSAVSELRHPKNGAQIDCRQGKDPKGNRCWYYRLIAPPPGYLQPGLFQ